MPNTVTNISFGLEPLPNVQWSGDVSQLLQLLVSHLTGTLESGAFVGQIGGSEPTSDIGLWLDNNTIKKWSSVAGKYLPLPVVAGTLFGSNLYTTNLISTAASGNIQLNLPDRNGATLATLDDISGGAGTGLVVGLSTVSETAVSGGTLSFDWIAVKNGGNLYATLTGSNGAVSVVEANSPSDGQAEAMWIEQSANGSSTPFTITWPASWVVSTGAVLTNRSSTNRIVDRFVVRRIGSLTFVEQNKSWSIPVSGAGSDTTAPTVTAISNTAGNSTVTISFSELLQGGVLDATKWAVMKNGASNAVSSAIASSNGVFLTVANTFIITDTGTVQYTGTDVKDSAGNTAASFGPSSILIAGSGIRGGGAGGFLGP
jgi:hypothetical protein